MRFLTALYLEARLVSYIHSLMIVSNRPGDATQTAVTFRPRMLMVLREVMMLLPAPRHWLKLSRYPLQVSRALDSSHMPALDFSISSKDATNQQTFIGLRLLV